MNGLKEQPVAEVIPAQEDGPALGDTSEPEEEALRRRRVKGKGHERAVEDSDKEHPSMSSMYIPLFLMALDAAASPPAQWKKD